MSAHAPYALPRSSVHYTAAGVSHKLLMHWAVGTDATLAQTNAAAVVAHLLPLSCGNVVFDGHDYAAAGSNIYNPTGWTNQTGTSGGTRVLADKPLYMSLVGRTVGACRERMFLFVVSTSTDANWRLTTSEWAALGTALTWLNSTSSALVARDGLGIAWKSYANLGYNAHWLKIARRG